MCVILWSSCDNFIARQFVLTPHECHEYGTVSNTQTVPLTEAMLVEATFSTPTSLWKSRSPWKGTAESQGTPNYSAVYGCCRGRCEYSHQARKEAWNACGSSSTSRYSHLFHELDWTRQACSLISRSQSYVLMTRWPVLEGRKAVSLLLGSLSGQSRTSDPL